MTHFSVQRRKRETTMSYPYPTRRFHLYCRLDDGRHADAYFGHLGEAEAAFESASANTIIHIATLSDKSRNVLLFKSTRTTVAVHSSLDVGACTHPAACSQSSQNPAHDN